MASWFSEGTVSVQNGSPTITGVGTKFSNCRSGDMFVGPDQGIYQVINPASDTSLAISPAYRGAPAAGAGYGIVPVNGYPKALADAVNQMVQQWGATLAGLGTVSTEDVVPVEKGGTGGTTQAAAHTGLGLGTAATRAVGTAATNLMEVGAGGWLGKSIVDDTNIDSARPTGLYSHTGALNAPYGALSMLSSDWGGNPLWQSQLALGVSANKAYFRSIRKDFTALTPWAELYHTGNTTRGSGGALSAASPILRIANVALTERRDLGEQCFEPTGDWGVANEEARGVTVERLGLGEYRVMGSLGLALEGWRTHDPSSPDGGRMLGITDSHQEEDGTVIIRLFKQRWTLTDDGEMVPGRGAPMDVPLNSWIDVRLEMPKIETPPTEAITEE